MKLRIYFFLFFFLLITNESRSFAQNNKIDSVLTLLKKEQLTFQSPCDQDTTKIRYLNFLSNEYEKIGSYKSALNYCNQAIELGNNLLLASGKSLNAKVKNVALTGIARAYLQTGGVYTNLADYPQALDYCLKSLKIKELLKDENGLGDVFNAIGNIHFYQSNFLQALDYYFRVLKIARQTGNQEKISISLGNIGLIYQEQKNFKAAFEYYSKAMKIDEEAGNKAGAARHLGNIGLIYYAQDDFQKALDFLFRALKVYEELGYNNEIVFFLGRIGCTYQDMAKNYSQSSSLKKDMNAKAEHYLLRAIDISDKTGYINNKMECASYLSELYEETKRPVEALKYYKLSAQMWDSIYNAEKDKEITRKEMNFEFEKKEAIARVEHEKEIAVTEADKRKRMIWLLIILLVAIIIAVVAFNTYRSLTFTKKQKQIIEEQKAIVEEKQKEILDSINYAQRIQYALLAHDELLKANLSEYFVLFKPKDIVSGDFYWATRKEDKFYLAVCDSTGHGVPGAFMSLLNISFLNEAINEKNIAEPNKILDHVRKRLIENVSQDGGQDGMDAILMCFDKTDHTISYSAAHNRPLLISKGQITALPADKMPIGKGEKTDPFALHTINAQKGDMLYLFTDGYADQFGGPKGKKYKYKQLEEKLAVLSAESPELQKKVLDETIIEWMEQLEQIDDICIVGIRL